MRWFSRSGVAQGVSLACFAACSFEHGVATDLPSDAGIDDKPDASVSGDDDVPGMDADADRDPDTPPAGTAVVISQSSSTTVSSGTSVYCGNMQTTRDNTWYRAFKLSDYGVTGTLHISRVTFAVEGTKGATVRIAIHSYTGHIGTTLELSKMTELTAKNDAIPDNATPIAALFSLDVPASSTIVLEVRGQDSLNGGGMLTSYFHLGANSAGQSGSSYWRSAACGVGTPSSQSGHHAIMSLEGSY